MSHYTGISSDIVESALPAVQFRSPGSFVFRKSDAVLYEADFTVSPPAFTPVSSGPSSAVARSVLTIGATVPAGPGVYANWPDLWAAYEQTSGAVDIVVVGNVSIPSGTYTLRSATRLRGAIQQSSLDAQDGAVIVDMGELMGVSLTGNSSSPILTFTNPNAGILLRDGAVIYQNGTAPCVLWTVPDTTGQLAIVMVTGGGLQSNNGNPVLSLQGTPGNVATANLLFGSYSNVGSNALAGNADSKIQTQALDPSGQLSPTQPGYLGTPALGPLQFTITTQLLFQNPGTNAPQGIGLAGEVTTTDATPTDILLVSGAIPPIISEIATFQLIARDVSNGDTKSWLIAVQLRSVLGTVTIQGPIDLIPAPFEDPVPQPWSYAILADTPSANMVSFRVTGEAGKTIKWVMRATVGLNITV